MTENEKSRQELAEEVAELSRRLEESEQFVAAIRSGAVDAVVVSTPEGEKIFTLQGAEHPYRVLVETMNEGAVTLGSDGTILYCNRRFAAMLDLPLQKIIGSSFASYVAPEDAAFFDARIAKCAAGCENHEMTLVTRGGQRLPVLVSCSSLDLAGSGEVSIIVTDITSRKVAEKTILRLNRLYAVLSGTNHAIVHATERLAIFREFCRVAVEAGGFRLAWVGVVNPDSGAARIAAASGEVGYLEGMEIATDPESEATSSFTMAFSEGTYYVCNDFSGDDITRPWMERAHRHGLRAVASVAIKEQEEPIGALTLYAEEEGFFDSQQIELLQQVGSEVSFALDNLQQAVLRESAERALQSETVERLRAVEELRQNEQMLVHQSRQAALGEMIGNIAHQWRQPLNALALMVQQVPLYYSLGEMDQEYLDVNSHKCMELIEHMSQTIDDFRNFFKPNKKKVSFSVKEELSRAISLMDGSFRAQGIEVEIAVSGDPKAYGYPNEFSQVLLNILINARDALVERKIPVPRVFIEVSSKDGRAAVTIADNAGGVPEEIIGKIFDPYFTTKGPQAGTGLGLFMSKTIIEKNMGGALSVRNTGSGAEFRIEV